MLEVSYSFILAHKKEPNKVFIKKLYVQKKWPYFLSSKCGLVYKILSSLIGSALL